MLGAILLALFVVTAGLAYLFAVGWGARLLTDGVCSGFGVAHWSSRARWTFLAAWTFAVTCGGWFACGLYLNSTLVGWGLRAVRDWRGPGGWIVDSALGVTWVVSLFAVAGALCAGVIFGIRHLDGDDYRTRLSRDWK
jgi:hypothetical protein